MKKIKTICFLLIIAINFTSCLIGGYKTYNMDYGADSQLNEIFLGIRIIYPDYRGSFFELTIYGYQDNPYRPNKKEHEHPGIKSITFDEFKMVTKNTVYDMKKYIYEIIFMDTVYSRQNFYRLTDLENFYNTGTIYAPTNEWFQGIEFNGKNPGLKYGKDKKITVLMDIKIEFQDGTIEEIKKEYKGKREIRFQIAYLFAGA
jgi:hypothetical protein